MATGLSALEELAKMDQLDQGPKASDFGSLSSAMMGNDLDDIAAEEGAFPEPVAAAPKKKRRIDGQLIAAGIADTLSSLGGRRTDFVQNVMRQKALAQRADQLEKNRQAQTEARTVAVEEAEKDRQAKDASEARRLDEAKQAEGRQFEQKKELIDLSREASEASALATGQTKLATQAILAATEVGVAGDIPTEFMNLQRLSDDPEALQTVLAAVGSARQRIREEKMAPKQLEQLQAGLTQLGTAADLFAQGVQMGPDGTPVQIPDQVNLQDSALSFASRVGDPRRVQEAEDAFAKTYVRQFMNRPQNVAMVNGVRAIDESSVKSVTDRLDLQARLTFQQAWQQIAPLIEASRQAADQAARDAGERPGAIDREGLIQRAEAASSLEQIGKFRP